MTMSRRCALAIAILAVALAPLGCGGDEDAPADAPRAKAPAGRTPEAKAGKDKRPASSPGDKAIAKLRAAKPPPQVVRLPENFPDDVPIYPKSTPTASLVNRGGDAVVSLSTTGRPSEVLAYYKSALGDNGWQVESEIADDLQSALVTKKDLRTATVLVLAGPAGTQIVLTIAEE